VQLRKPCYIWQESNNADLNESRGKGLVTVSKNTFFWIVQNDIKLCLPSKSYNDFVTFNSKQYKLIGTNSIFK
jgi:hypothetical protein